MAGKNQSLGDAVSGYLSGLAPEVKKSAQAELNRFTRSFGKDRPIRELTGTDIESFAERLSVSDADYPKKLDLIKTFLVYAKDKELTKSNLSIHLKPRKGKAIARKGKAKKGAPEPISMTRQGHAKLKEELAGLKEERHKVIAEVRKAAADKDFRENAPLHAAREKRGHIEGKIMEIEGTLKAAVVVETEDSSVLRVNLGDKVYVCEANSEEVVCYTLVGPKEADVIKGKISSASPMGQAILGREQGETVIIEAPMGKLTYSIKQIQR